MVKSVENILINNYQILIILLFIQIILSCQSTVTTAENTIWEKRGHWDLNCNRVEEIEVLQNTILEFDNLHIYSEGFVIRRKLSFMGAYSCENESKYHLMYGVSAYRDMAAIVELNVDGKVIDYYLTSTFFHP